MKLINEIKVNSILFVHVSQVIFVTLTWPLIFFSHIFNEVYLFVLAITFIGYFLLGRECLLTKIENKLLQKYNPKKVYKDACIAHYSQKWLGFRVESWFVGIVITILLLLSIYNLIK